MILAVFVRLGALRDVSVWYSFLIVFHFIVCKQLHELTQAILIVANLRNGFALLLRQTVEYHSTIFHISDWLFYVCIAKAYTHTHAREPKPEHAMVPNGNINAIGDSAFDDVNCNFVRTKEVYARYHEQLSKHSVLCLLSTILYTQQTHAQLHTRTHMQVETRARANIPYFIAAPR